MGALFDGLISWSIHNRVVVLLGAAALVAAGVWSAMHASLDVLPDFTPPFVVVQTEATGMATLDVEQLVTRPLEQVLLGTPETTAVRSTSTPGLSVVSLDDVAAAYGVGKRTLLRYAATGELQVTRFGRKYVVTVSELLGPRDAVEPGR